MLTRKRPRSGPLALKDDPRAQSPPEYKGQVWDCRLLAAGTSDGEPFEILPIVDEQSRECLATLVDRNIGSQEVTDRLFDLFVLRGAPECIRSDDGPESLVKAVDDWLRQTGVETRLVKGDSWKGNGGESFSGKLRDALTNKTTFTTLPEAKAAIEGWRERHNETLRRHAALAEDPCQSPRLQSSARPSILSSDSPADEVGCVPSILQQDTAGVQEEPYEAPGLPGSPQHGTEARPSILSSDSPGDEADSGQFVPQEDTAGVQEEPYDAPGLPGALWHGIGARPSVLQHDTAGVQVEPYEAPEEPASLRWGTEARPSILSWGSPADVAEAVQSIPQPPGGQLDPGLALGLPGSLRWGTEARPSTLSYGSVGSAARTRRSAWSILKAPVVVGQAAPSLGPSSQRHRVATPAVRVKNAVVRMSEWVGIATVTLLVIAVALALVAPNFGWRVDTVVSGSMEPELGVGSVIITRPLEAEAISVGDVITFRSPTSRDVISHRVVAIESGPSFRTEGIANEEADPFVVPAYEVDGRVCFHAPLVGYVLQYFRTPIGLLLLFFFGFAIVIAEIGSMFELRRKDPA